MKKYNVVSTDRKKFEVVADTDKIGTLAYENWFSFKAQFSLVSQNGTFWIEPIGFWGTTIEVRKGNDVLLDFKMNWSGNIIINTKFDPAEIDFVLKHKGIFNSGYLLADKHGNEMLYIQPDFKWQTFRTDYLITTTDAFDKLEFNEILLLSIVHCTNYFMSMNASSGV